MTFTEYAKDILRADGDELQKMVQLLEQVAGGGPYGAQWHAEREVGVSILDHAKETLLTINTNQVDSLTAKTQDRVQTLKQDTDILRRAGTDEDPLKGLPGVQAQMDAAGRALKRAAATKLETLMCKILERKSSKSGARLLACTTTFVSECREPWQSWVHEDLAKIVEPQLTS